MDSITYDTNSDKELYSRTVNEDLPTLSKFFKDIREELQLTMGIGEGNFYPNEEIAKLLDISGDQLRK